MRTAGRGDGGGAGQSRGGAGAGARAGRGRRVCPRADRGSRRTVLSSLRLGPLLLSRSPVPAPLPLSASCGSWWVSSCLAPAFGSCALLGVCDELQVREPCLRSAVPAAGPALQVGFQIARGADASGGLTAWSLRARTGPGRDCWGPAWPRGSLPLPRGPGLGDRVGRGFVVSASREPRVWREAVGPQPTVMWGRVVGRTRTSQPTGRLDGRPLGPTAEMRKLAGMDRFSAGS